MIHRPRQVWQDFPLKLALTAVCVLAALAVFTLARAGLFYFYRPAFASLAGPEIREAFLQGLRFDFSIISLFLGPFIFLLFLPVKSARWAKGCFAVMCFVLGAMALMLAADFIYFPQAKRHMAEELLHASHELRFLLRYALTRCWPHLSGLVLTCAGALWAGFYFIGKRWRPVRTPLWQSVLAGALVLLIAFTGIRGKLGGGKPLSMTDIHRLSSGPAQASLMLNGVFSSYHSMRKGQTTPANPMPKEKALQTARESLATPAETFVRDDYPLMRRLSAPGAFRPKNVMVVLLESWTPRYVDSFGGGSYGVTPHFDRMARKGVRFDNAYATGVRSIFGLSAALAGVPLIPGLPHFAYGLELNGITSLARTLGQKGYYTAFIQSSLRSSYQMCNISKKVFGVEESFGMEDIPRLLDYQAEQDFGYDYDLLQFAADKAAAARQNARPFFLFTFTGTTHTPFRQTTPEFDKYPRISEENKYLNTLYYADYAIGQLLKRAAQDGWLKDTVFVFMADHTEASSQKDDELLEKFRIPFVIYAPGLLEPGRVDYAVSQLDLIPTLYHLLNIDQPFTALGNNALDPHAPHFAFIAESGNLALVDQTGYLRHDRLRALESSAPPGAPAREKLQNTLLSLDKSVTALFENNRWFAPQDPQK